MIPKAIYEFLVATLPAVVLYFVGWAYLYFFLGAFGINIAEIYLDTTTIFIYAFSPFQIAAKAYGIWVLLGIVGIAVLVWIVARFIPRGWKAAFKHARHKTSQSSIGIRIFLLIIAFVFLLLALLPILQWAAIRQKMQVWAGNGGYIVPLLHEEASKQTAPSQPSPWRESYMQCSDQQALLLIYSDEKAYYVLCKSNEDSNEGYVFEVRRDFGLSSVRFASAGGEQ